MKFHNNPTVGDVFPDLGPIPAQLTHPGHPDFVPQSCTLVQLTNPDIPEFVPQPIPLTLTSLTLLPSPALLPSSLHRLLRSSTEKVLLCICARCRHLLGLYPGRHRSKLGSLHTSSTLQVQGINLGHS